MQDPVSRVDALVSAFSKLPEAEIGHGSDHPTSPTPSLREPINRYFEQYPFLRADESYMAFVYRYCGAFAVSSEADIAIYVFAPAGYLHDPNADEAIDEDGYFIFGYTEFWCGEPRIENGVLVGFGFDATGKRSRGIHRTVIRESKVVEPWSWYCETFVEWLNLAIQNSGRFWGE